MLGNHVQPLVLTLQASWLVPHLILILAVVTQEHQLPAATSATVARHGRGAVPIPTGGPGGTIKQGVGQFIWNRRGLSKMRCQRAKGLYLGFKHWVGGGRELGLTRDWVRCYSRSLHSSEQHGWHSCQTLLPWPVMTWSNVETSPGL